MSSDDTPVKKEIPSRGFDVVKGTYYIMKPDGEKKEWKIKATHDKPETIDTAIAIADQYKEEMTKLYKNPNWTDKDKMRIHTESTRKLLEIVFERFDYDETIKLGINYKKLSNTAGDIKDFLVEIGGLDELRLLTQRNVDLLNISSTTKI